MFKTQYLIKPLYWKRLRTKGKVFQGSDLFYPLLLLFMLSMAAFLGYYILFSGHNWGGDFALYISQTQSIVEGNAEDILMENTYSMEYSTQMPGSNPQIGPYLYPWGFPLLLVPVYMLFGPNIFAMKVYVLGFFILTLIMVYCLFRRKIEKKYTLLIVALLAFNPTLLLLADDVGSDMPYTFFALLSLFFMQRLMSRKYVFSRAVTLIITGCLIFFAFLVRTNGIVLLGTLLLCQIIQLRSNLKPFRTFSRRFSMEYLPYVSFGILFLLSKLVLPSGSGSHLAFLSRITPGKLAYNVIYYTKLPAEFLSSTPIPFILYGISIPFLMYGIYQRIQKDYHYIIYSVGTLAIFILWPPLQGLRFIISVLPFYLYFTFWGLLKAEANLRKKSRAIVLNSINFNGTLTLVVLIFFLFQATNSARANINHRHVIEGPYEKSSQEVFEFINTSTEKGDIIVFFKPRVVNFFTERTAIRVVKYQEIVDGKGDYLVFYKNGSFGQINSDNINSIK